MRSPHRPLSLAILGLVGFAVVLGVAGLNGWGDPAANEQAIGEISRWCERVNGGFFREPVNTLGNLGFVVAGLLMFATLAKDTTTSRAQTNRFIGNTNIAVLYASTALFLGPGSMVMHGTHTRFGAWIDNVSMVAYILIPWLFNLSVHRGAEKHPAEPTSAMKRKEHSALPITESQDSAEQGFSAPSSARWREGTLFKAYGAILTIYAAGYWFIAPDLGIGMDLFGLSIALWAITEVIYRFWSPSIRWWSGFIGLGVALVFGITPAAMLANPGDYWWVILFWIPGLLTRGPAPGRRRYFPWFWVGVGSFMVAYAIWLTGTDTHPACEPDSLLQPHAFWHLLTAMATLSFFYFLRTEREIVGAVDKR